MINLSDESIIKNVLDFSSILFDFGYSIYVIYYQAYIKDKVNIKVKKQIKLKAVDFKEQLEGYLIEEDIFISKIIYCPLGTKIDSIHNKHISLDALEKEYIIDKADDIVHLHFN